MTALKAILEIFGRSTAYDMEVDWSALKQSQECPFVAKQCFKVRKSSPDVSIGTCTVGAGSSATPLVICPNRFLERRQVFVDCLHLLTLHVPGNVLYVVPEFSIPGGSVDYMLVSAWEGSAVDFVGIEFQALDTTGSVWPRRQAALAELGLTVAVPEPKPFGINWKMTAKTILMQLHHKTATFEAVNRHLVCVLQDSLLSYFDREFEFDHVEKALPSNALHFHSYKYTPGPSDSATLSLSSQRSTSDAGLARCLRHRAQSPVVRSQLLSQLSSRLLPENVLGIA